MSIALAGHGFGRSRFRLALLLVFLSALLVGTLNAETRGEGAALGILAAALILSYLAPIFRRSDFPGAGRFALFVLPVFLVLAASFGPLSRVLLPASLVLTLVAALWNLLPGRSLLAALLSLPAVLAGFVLSETLQPPPSPLAGAYEIHIPGAEGLRWDLDLFTNLFGDFDTRRQIMVDGRTWPIKKPGGRFRLLWVGDSQSIGPGVPRNETAAHVMGRRLQDRASGVRIETINAGIYGGDDLMQWIYFDQVLRRLSPDLVVVTWSGRVVAPYGARTIYPRILEILRQCGACDTETKKLAVKYDTANIFALMLRSRVHQSRLARNLKDHFRWGEPEHPALIPKSIEELGEPPPPSREEVIGYFLKDAEKMGYQLIFVPEIDESLSHFEPSYVRILKEMAPDQWIDIRPAFAFAEGRELFADFAHFRAKGHRLLGEFLAEEVLRRGMIEERGHGQDS